jgi:hypothetical protein
MIERLEKKSLFKNVRLVSADENKLYTQLGAEFGIVCDVNLDNLSSSGLNPPASPLILASPPLTKGETGGLSQGKEKGVTKARSGELGRQGDPSVPAGKQGLPKEERH